MEKTFTIAVKKISTNIIISEWAHIMLLRKIHEQQQIDPDNIMLWSIANASPWLIYYAYADYCGREKLPVIFNQEEIKQSIADAGNDPIQLQQLHEVGRFWELVADNYEEKMQE